MKYVINKIVSCGTYGHINVGIWRSSYTHKLFLFNSINNAYYDAWFKFTSHYKERNCDCEVEVQEYAEQ